MKKPLFFAAIAFLTAAATAQAHFTFIVPDPDEHTARLFLSETLTPDEGIDTSYVAHTTLSLRDAADHETPLVLTTAPHALIIKIPGGEGTRVIHGVNDLGITSRGADHPYDLIYFPKTVLGNPFDSHATLGPTTPLELIPIGNVHAVQLKLLADGKPEPDSEITLLLPDGSSKTLTTHADGLTDPFTATAPGHYGAWARYFDKTPGTRDQQKFDETREYATLVFDPAPPNASAAASQPAPDQTPKDLFATLPQAASSFGAVAADGYLYVYGGHIAVTHTYSTQAVSGQFHRLKLSDTPADRTWDTLPGGPPLQGLNLAAANGKIYRIGGMQPQNAPGQPEDTVSLDTTAVFDPAANAWSTLPPLPAPRSSHDIAVIGHTLYVVGGWDLKGQEQDWQNSVLSLDLSDKNAVWQTHPQPFHRRALIAAVYQDKLYVIGGFDENEEVVNRVDIFDPKSDQWSAGPELPAKGFAAFGPAACTLHGKLFVSLSDGSLLRLDNDHWTPVGHALPRLVHRIAPFDNSILIIGGAGSNQNYDSIERVTPSDTRPADAPHQ